MWTALRDVLPGILARARGASGGSLVESPQIRLDRTFNPCGLPAPEHHFADMLPRDTGPEPLGDHRDRASRQVAGVAEGQQVRHISRLQRDR